jgi:hypothetical protein
VKKTLGPSVHQYCGLGVEAILKNSLYRQSLDNVTVVMVAFANFKRALCGPSKNEDIYNALPQNQKEESQRNKSATPGNQEAQDKENNVNLVNKKKYLSKHQRQPSDPAIKPQTSLISTLKNSTKPPMKT